MVLLLNLPRNIEAYIFVFICVFSFASLYLVDKADNKDRNFEIAKGYKQFGIEANFDKINKWVIVINGISLVYLAYHLGFRPSTFLHVNTLIDITKSIAKARYAGDRSYLPVVNRIVNSLVYATCGYCGFFMVKKPKCSLLMNVGLLMLQVMLTNTKATLVFGAAFWAGGYLTGFQFYGKKIRKITVVRIVGVLIGMFCFVAGVDYLRHGGIHSYIWECKKILVAYFVGPFSAFSVWHESGEAASSLGLGKNTFACIFRLLGIAAQKHGKVVEINGVETNVYTIFKHLINDYSYVGTVIISFVAGFISVKADKRIAEQSCAGVGIAIVMTTVIMVAFFSSLFRYTINILASMLIIFATLLIEMKAKGDKNE